MTRAVLCEVADWEVLSILLCNEFQWADWRLCLGASIILWARVNWGRWMNRWFSWNCKHKEQSQAAQRPLLFLFPLTSLESCSQVSSASCQIAVLPFQSITEIYVVIIIFPYVCFYRAQTSPGEDECTTMRSGQWNSTSDQELDTNDADRLPKVPHLDLVQYNFLYEFNHVKCHVNVSFFICIDWYLVVFFYHMNNYWWKCFQTEQEYWMDHSFCKILYIDLNIMIWIMLIICVLPFYAYK